MASLGKTKTGGLRNLKGNTMKLRALILGSALAAVCLSTGAAYAIGSGILDGQQGLAIDCIDSNIVAQGGIRFDPLAIDDVATAMQTLRDDGGGMIEGIYPDGNGALDLAIPTLHPDDNILVISARDSDLNGDTYQLYILDSAIASGDPKRLQLQSWPTPLHLSDAGDDLMVPMIDVDLRHGKNSWQGGLGAGLSHNAV
jgi:hypothetical protein